MVRVEQLYPFPADVIKEVLERYPKRARGVLGAGRAGEHGRVGIRAPRARVADRRPLAAALHRPLAQFEPVGRIVELARREPARHRRSGIRSEGGSPRARSRAIEASVEKRYVDQHCRSGTRRIRRRSARREVAEEAGRQRERRRSARRARNGKDRSRSQRRSAGVLAASSTKKARTSKSARCSPFWKSTNGSPNGVGTAKVPEVPTVPEVPKGSVPSATVPKALTRKPRRPPRTLRRLTTSSSKPLRDSGARVTKQDVLKAAAPPRHRHRKKPRHPPLAPKAPYAPKAPEGAGGERSETASECPSGAQLSPAG